MASSGWIKASKAVLARTDLTPAAKLLFFAIVDQMKGTGSVSIGTKRLRAMTGLGRGAIVRARAELARANLLEVGAPGNGRRCVYGLLETGPETGPVPKQDRSRNRTTTGPETGPVCHSSSKRRPSCKNPPTPPRGDAWAEACDAMTGDSLKTDRFKAAWLEWVGYRAETRHKLTAATVTRQIRKLEGFGHDRAIEAIEASIGQGWRGLFEPKVGRARPGRVEARPGKYDNVS